MSLVTPDSSGFVPVPLLARNYPKGLLVRRWVGAWVDLIVLGSFLLIPDVVLGNERYQQTVVLWLALLVLYFPLSEGLAGRTLGKVITGTKVVTAGGENPGVLRAAVRTLTRVLEVNPFLLGGLPAGIAVLSSQHHQRLGDMAARTYVVLVRDLPGGTAEDGPDPYPALNESPA